VPTALIAVATVLALIYAKKVPEPVLILVAALVGLLASAWRG
jgi:chromate transporter